MAAREAETLISSEPIESGSGAPGRVGKPAEDVELDTVSSPELDFEGIISVLVGFSAPSREEANGGVNGL
jgi:hypothetical protein